MTSLIVDFPRGGCAQFEHEVHMPDATTKKHRTVRFSPNSTLHCFEAPQDRCASSWYSSIDQRRFKREAKREIVSFQRMEMSGRDIKRVLHGDQMCLVGLEQQLVSREFTKKRAITRRLVILAVLTEQARHLSYKADDKPARIAAASMQHSEW
eukprot:CAMPEP_0172308734 /NCGR_PEP_ID=MMETSP1058-20130122/9250_1 /TAXON_ID=83371 /ORGANISM="Detonula confervacea, Strain CCMP 353" /LENGTH=152 /DNA_ID=CAMNT_0013021225 /DNA_START=25 /DNA_END=480 /DNA_ORIENTATION=-